VLQRLIKSAEIVPIPGGFEPAREAWTGSGAAGTGVGRFIGPRVFQSSHRLLNKAYLDRAHVFFEQYGGKAVILGRFVPIVRTFVPFVAGAAQMTTASFVMYNLVGAVAWVSLCLGAGWFFGNIPIIKNNFSLVTIGIVFVSVLPMVFEMIAHRRRL
jgi:membrane-associated protein